MSIISAYITREIARYFGIILAVVICIYIAVDFFEKIDDFLETGVSVYKAVFFFMFKTPFIVAQVLPVCILLAILITFGLMTKNNELTALKSCGISIYYFIKPIVLIGLVCSVFLFFLSEVIVPITSARANKIWLREVRKEPAVISREKNIWIKGNRLITHIIYYNPAKQAVFGISIYRFDQDFRLIRRIDAKNGVYQSGRWILYNLMEQKLNEADGNYVIKFFEEKIEPLDISPDDLKRVVKKSEEMTFKEILDYVRKIEAEGYDASSYRVDLHAKAAFPFVCLIMCLVGMGIALSGKIKAGLPVSIGCGTASAFFYWIFYSFCVSLGYGEVLPPAIAAWTANFIFLCFGMLTLVSAE